MRPLIRKWLWRLLVILAVGALPATALVVLDEYHHGIDAIPACIFFGALWGVTLGVLRRSLGSSILGLNVGGLLGFGFGKYMEYTDGTARDPIANALFLFLLSILGTVLYSTRRNLIRSMLHGGIAGFAAGAVILAGFWLVVGTQHLIKSVPILIAILCVLPLTAGLAIFVWLLLDVFPRWDGSVSEIKKPE